MKLNLGCSDDQRPGYIGVDRVQPADVVADLNSVWPWEDSTIDEIFAHDVAEHVDNPMFPGNKGKTWFLNEAWRVLKPGGILDLLVPCVMLADGHVNPGAFCDPTHVSFWTMDDRYYYCENWNHPRGERGRLGPAYGIKAVFREVSWKLIEYGAGSERRSKVAAYLEAVK